ncbi:MAG: hypothetical protein ABI921_08360 [Panacibacter sp.]
MIKSLRKKHLQIWTILAVLLPVGIITAWMVIPEQAKDKLLQPVASETLPVILKTVDKDNYAVTLRTNSDTSVLQLEWNNKKTLTCPTATIYKTKPEANNITNSDLIGRIEARGTYYFKADSGFINTSTYQLVLYDFIHQQQIDIIKF